MDKYKIPVYILTKNEYLNNEILGEFDNKPEFLLFKFSINKRRRSKYLIFHCFQKIIKDALNKNEEIIVICTECHRFTDNYNYETFIEQILIANSLKMKYILGGITGGVVNSVYIDRNLFWIDIHQGGDFIVLFTYSFEEVLYKVISETPSIDEYLHHLTANKMLIYPFISRTEENNCKGVFPKERKNKFEHERIDLECRFNKICEVLKRIQSL